jgi:hypothetical protein
VRDVDLGRHGPGDPVGLGPDAAQHGGDQVDDRDLLLAEPDVALLDAALRVGLEAVRLQAGGVHGVTAGEDRAARVDVDRGG